MMSKKLTDVRCGFVLLMRGESGLQRILRQMYANSRCSRQSTNLNTDVANRKFLSEESH